MISNKLRCVHIHIPKTGGHSIEKFFQGHQCGEAKHGDWHATIEERKRDPVLKDYLFFAVIRNPWDRAVSEYFWQKTKPWGNRDISFSGFCHSDWGWYPDDEIRHCWEQSDFICDDTGRVLVEKLIRFENLQVEFDDLKAKLGLPDYWKLPHFNRTEHLPYRRYYTDELRHHIGNVFERDVLTFDYEF